MKTLPETAALPLTALVSALLTAGLLWPLPLHPGSAHILTPFGDSHVWAFDQMARMMSGEHDWAVTTYFSGYPRTQLSLFIGWLPALMALPLRAVMNPLAAFNTVLLLTPTLSALLTYALLRRVTEARPWVAGAASLIYAFCPYMLSNLGNGNIEKAQQWFYPAYLLLMWILLKRKHGWIALPLFPALALAMVFTEPYFGLILPLIATPFAFWYALVGPESRLKKLPLALVALGLTAAALLPANTYFSPHRTRSISSVFMPAAQFADEPSNSIYVESPVAQPKETFLGVTGPAVAVDEAYHVTYLVLPVVIFAVLLCVRSARGRWLGLLLLLGGVLMAAGPRLVVDGIYMNVSGRPYYLPMELLNRLGYPLSKGGQYYRAIPIASLGLAVMLAAGLTPYKRGGKAPWAVGFAWLLAAVAFGDAVRTTGPYWPRPVERVAGWEQYMAMRETPTDGAVLALPIISTQARGGYKLLCAALHQRPTNAIPRHVIAPMVHATDDWIRKWQRYQEAGEGAKIPTYLSRQGFRYVVLTDPANGADAEIGLGPEDLRATLGAPDVDGDILVWDLGPTELLPENYAGHWESGSDGELAPEGFTKERR